MSNERFNLLGVPLRVVLMLLLLVLLGMLPIVSTYLFVDTAFFCRTASHQLSGIFAGSFQIGEVRLNPDPSIIEIYGVSVMDPQGTEVVRARSVIAHIDWAALTRNEFRVEYAEVNHSEALLEWDEQGNFGLADAFVLGPGYEEDPDAEAGDFAFVVGRAVVNDASATLDFVDFDIRVESSRVEDFSMVAGGGQTTMHANRVHYPRGKAVFEPDMFGMEDALDPDGSPKSKLEVPLRDVSVDHWNWANDGFTVDRVEYTAAEARFELTNGHMDFSSPEGFGWGGDLAIAMPAHYIGLEYFTGPLVSTPLELKFSAAGFLGAEMNDHSHTSVKFSMDTADLEVMGSRWDRAVLEGHLVNRRIYLTQVDMQGYGGRITLLEDAEGPLPSWMDPKYEPPAMPGRGWVNILDLDYELPLVIEQLAVSDVLDDMVPAIPEKVLLETEGELDAELHARGRLVPGVEPQRLRSVPAWHEVQVETLRLNRPAIATTRQGATLPTRRVSLTGGVRFADDKLAGLSPIDIKLDADTVRVSNFSLDLSVPERPVVADIVVNAQDVRPYLIRHGVADISGRVSLRAHAEGPLLNPRIDDARLMVTRPEVVGMSAEDLDVRFSYDNGWVTMGNVQTRGDFGEIEARGRIKVFDGSFDKPLRDPVLDLRGRAPEINVDQVSTMLSLDLPVSGTISAEDVRVSGTARRPDIAARAMADDLTVVGELLTRVEVDVDISRNRVVVPRVFVKHYRGARLDGRVDWRTDGGEIDAHLALRGGDLAHIRELEEQAIAGEIRHVDLDVVGNLRPSQIVATGPATRESGNRATTTGGDIIRWITTQPVDVDGTAAVRDVVVGGMRFGGLVASWDSIDRRSVDASLRANDETCPGDEVFLVSAAWLPEISPEGQALIVDQPDTGIASDRRYLVRPSHPAYASVDVCVPRDATHPYITAKVGLDHLNIRGMLGELLRPWLDAEEGGAVSSAEVELSAIQVAQLSATAKMDPSRQRLVRRRRRGVARTGTLANVFRFWTSTHISGEVEVEYNRLDESYVTFATLSHLEVGGLGRRLTNTRPVELVFDGRTLAVDSLTIRSGENQVLELSGAYSLGDQDKPKEERNQLVTLFVKGDLDLALLNFYPTVLSNMRGIAAVDMSLTGPPAALQTEGELTFSADKDKRFSFGIRGIGQELTVKSGGLVVDSNGVRIRNDNPIHIEVLGGDAVVTGGLDMDNYVPGELAVRVKADYMSYRIPDTANLTFNADLGLSMTKLSRPETWALSGKVNIVEGRVYRDFYFLQDNTIGQFLRATRISRAQRYERGVFDQLPWLSDVTVDVDIEGRDSLFVQNIVEPFEVDLEVRTDINLRNNARMESPQLRGSVSVLPGGQLLYRGAEFEIRTGELVWTGDLSNPDVNFVTETEIVNSCAVTAGTEAESELGEVGSSVGQIQVYAINLTIDGRLDNMNPQLSSTPYADQHDIYALLAVGCLADGVNASADGAVIEIGLRPILSGIEDRIKGFTDVDEVRIGYDLETTRIRLAEHVTNRFIIGGEGAFGNETSEQRGYLRYLFSDDVFVEASEKTDESSRLGIDVKLKWLIPLE